MQVREAVTCIDEDVSVQGIMHNRTEWRCLALTSLNALVRYLR
jgi:hypothetical protein